MLVSAEIGVWAIFIIISVVAQIIKARKKSANQEPMQPESKGDNRAPAKSEDDLRQFLEKLAGGRPQRTAPAEVNIPQQVVPPRPPPTPRQAPPQPRPQRPQPKPVASPPPTPPTTDAQPVNAAKRTNTIAGALQNLLRAELQQGDSIQKAIVLREILGPPIGLKPRDRRG